ncbi:putative fatty acyl CoA synthetase 2 [Leptomonas pyrrhocoris]|uniref:Putative fatty acyl CoA synthetase 2 n=1 Tax=Leptomonas pyrrhocoris TaxID=157538 RepID=A0A0N0VCZ2_LEPPY|nr:putative fatty acyl CoA synthetase 2 [Leptomonas pyrrhocoris]KPA73724.1 putative fatty acyl CoA synthetase 2 [Leptomonas pyrrhocoris]|eukprot:XP_015652163.1 putative fatty acyl CoA synthetase 2 [Leptomonas pyrrhocoris]
MDAPEYRAKLAATVLQLMEEENARHVAADPQMMLYSRLGDEALPVEGTEQQDGTPVYHHAKVRDGSAFDDVAHEWYNGPNFVQRFESICRSRGNKRAFAYRPTIRVSAELVKDPESGLERKFDVTFFDATKYLSYTEVWTTIENFGRGLCELGIPQDCKIALYLETRWEWLVSAYGVWSQNMVLTTVFSNLGEEALSEAFAETSCAAVVTVGERVPSLIAMMRRGAMPYCVLIYLDSLPANIEAEGISLRAWEDVVRDGGLSVMPVRIPTNNDDLALIMYTSGTTGGPKGVMHTFGSITSGVRGMGEKWNELLGPLKADECYVAALPLSHVFEFVMCVISLARGCWIGFGHPRTLLNTYAQPHGDLVEFKPSLLVGVPRIFDNYKKTMEASLAPRGSLERCIFDHAFASRVRYMKQGMQTPFWNEVVFRPFQEMVGGRVRSMFGGGSPVSSVTQTFFNVVIGGFIQGYGLTETIGNGAKQLIGDKEVLCVGQPERCVELKLVDTEDYKHTDIPEPRGEICLRGPMLFKGYYKKEAVAKAVIDEEGWFHTGDVGAVADRGRLRIVSRIKSLAKTSAGENIPMEYLESLYAQSSLCVPNGVCVMVHPSKNYIAAVASTTESRAMMFAREHGIKGGWPALLKSPEFLRKSTEAFQEIAMHAGRGRHEIVRYVRLVADHWTTKNELISAANKPRRRLIYARYAKEIEELFSE